ncbi:hypothetical protein EX895_003068 [Sporisorium graminicola]|uniref:SEC7 domain-containing protein n=1 Tax=Sporisorium graminicola TaxID=280036 RepID=A0A4U7KYN1_9BASI|nr:hypothetical protein EX895_003068 [Sporisorium graminicola]TKY87972.1 hypothetical protein EX895_003068 [Sporisorium graminicola]
MMQTSPAADIAAAGPGGPGLVRQGSAARTNAIAMLKRAASQREIKSRAETPALPGAFPSDSETHIALSNSLADSSIYASALDSSQPSLSLTTPDQQFDSNAAREASLPHDNGLSHVLPPQSSYPQHYPLDNYPVDNAIASTSTSTVPASIPMLLAPSSSNEASDRSRSPMFYDRFNQRNFNRSPLPSLEQLRARILLERESEGLQRSASTSAASQAARAYALEKLLGNSGTDVFYDHTPDGTLIGRGAATPSPTPMSGLDDGLADMASDDESAHETRLKRQSIKNRPSLRRSRTVNGLTAMAEAQKKAEFVQGVFLAVPGPASNRISRIHQRRVERQSILKLASERGTEAALPEESPAAPLNHVEESAPSLARQQSQRQIARTEMMRKLSTRGRANPTPTPQHPSDQAWPADPADASVETIRQQRLPQVITDSPAVDEAISPVGVVIRPPSSPVPPHFLHVDAPSPAPAFRRSLLPDIAASPGVYAHAAVATQQHDPLAASASSPGLKASSSAASLASHYAHSTATNASALHLHERNRESAMALLNNEDSFGYETSPLAPSTSIDAEAASISVRSAAMGSVASGNVGNDSLNAPGLQDDFESENDGLTVEFGRDPHKRRRAGIVGLGLDSVPSRGAPTAEAKDLDAIDQQTRNETGAGRSPRIKGDAAASKRVSELRQSLPRVRPQQLTTHGLLSSPGSHSDDEPLEDDAFYKLYSPAPNGFEDVDESEEDEEDDRNQEQDTGATAKTNKSASDMPLSQAMADTATVNGLGFTSSGGTPKHGQQSPQETELPTTPPQRLFHRSSAAVPCDPSPSTETEFGEARRTPWVASSPSGFNVPLRLSNSLMSTAQAIASDSPATDPSPVMRGTGAPRTARSDWPMSIASSGTLPPSRESLEGRGEVEARLRSSEEGRGLNAMPAIGSPVIEEPEIEAKEEEHNNRRLFGRAGATAATDSDFELLPVPTAREKPSERVRAMLGPKFVAEYGADLDLASRSPSSMAGDEDHNLKIPNPRANASSLSNTSNVSINEISDVDGEVDEAYLRKVDRMADKLGKLARTNKVIGVNGNTGVGVTRAASSRTAVPPAAPRLEYGNIATGSRFTEHVSSLPGSHSQRPSADLSALVGNEKLSPFPGLSKSSPVQSQEGFSRMTVSAAPPSSTLAATVHSKDVIPGISEAPLYATTSKDDQDGAGKQIGLFSSLRRKASSLKRTPSSAKETGGFWTRRGKREESPKLPTEATFISAPILTEATPGPAPTAAQPIVTVNKSQEDATNGMTMRRQRENDATFEHRLFDEHSTDKTAAAAAATAAADLQRNASISSVVSARIRPDLQDGTADADAVSTLDHHGTAAKALTSNTADMMHRYSRMLSTAGPMQALPGTTQEDMEDPPRKLLVTDPVFQVISATTIKDRYLFLFSDILVVAKPVAAPGAEAGQTMGQMKQAAVLPTLSWKFSVKNILELHRLKVSVTTNTRTASAKTRAQNPVLWGFVSHFSKDPDAAVRALVAKTGLEPSPASIAQLLYQTPELDRDDLTQYLGHASRREILKAYVSQHRHVGVSIESALRSLLLDLRFPTDLDAFEALLVHFAQSWTQHNASMIKPTFTAQIASDLVFAIMALNDALHTGSQAGASSVTSPNFPRPVTVVTPGLFSAPCRELSKGDFVSVFRQHDPDEVLSDRTLSRIYLSIRSEPLVQALDRYEPRFTIRVKGGKLPTRLTYAQPAEPVTLVIPAPDPDLAIRLYAQDTTFEPPILTFSTSNEASFTMWTKSLGPKQVVFVRAGRNARFYGGTEMDVTDAPTSSLVTEDSPLPRSFNVTVERAFMKHSFTLTSVSSSSSSTGQDTKRFMFSFEDADKVGRWTRAIREQAERCIKQKASRAVEDVGTTRATETASLQVLREALIGVEALEPQGGGGLARAMTVSETPRAIAVGGAGRAGQSGLGIGGIPSGLRAPATATAAATAAALLDRTTSTSRHYYAASGVGRHERELLIPPSSSSSAMAGESRHTKGSASLSLYPPSTSVTRLVPGLSPSGAIGRSNSARSASSPHSPLSALPPTDAATGSRGGGASGHSVGGGARTGAGGGGVAEGAKPMQGTHIVNVVRLNSLLVRVVAAHQQQTHQQ